MQKLMQKGMRRDEAIYELYPEWIRLQEICAVKPLEEAFPLAIQDMQKEGIVVFALTHRHPPVAIATLRQIASLDLDFEKTAPTDLVFLFLPQSVLYEGSALCE